MQTTDIKISGLDRFKHIYIAGKTQLGKSSLISHLALKDIRIGRGVCVMDAKSKLVDDILEHLPEHRKDDVILLDRKKPIALDFMSYEDEDEKEKIIGEIKFLYTKSESLDNAPTIRSNLDNIVHTLLNYNDNPATDPAEKATFLDILWFLEDEERRKKIIRPGGLTSKRLIAYWNDPEKLPKGENKSRLTSRLTEFVNNDRLIQIFDAPNPKFNVARAIKERKIILVKLGDITQSQSIYATLLLAKIRQAMDRNSEVPDPDIIPFFLYCDEFQKFQTSDFPDMLSRAGGLGLALTLVNQYPKQLSSEIQDAIEGTVSSRIAFQMEPGVAGFLRGTFPRPDRNSYPPIPDYFAMLPHLQVGECIYKIADGSYGKARTPNPHERKKPQRNHAAFVKYVQDATEQNYHCGTVKRSYHQVNTPIDDIPPTPPKPVPPNPHKAARPRTAR